MKIVLPFQVPSRQPPPYKIQPPPVHSSNPDPLAKRAKATKVVFNRNPHKPLLLMGIEIYDSLLNMFVRRNRKIVPRNKKGQAVYLHKHSKGACTSKCLINSTYRALTLATIQRTQSFMDQAQNAASEKADA